MTDTHVLTQLRRAVATLLTGLPTSGANVFPSRTRPTRDEMLPALLVYTRDETSQRVANGLRENVCELVVRCRVATTAAEPDDLLDAMALEVDRLLAGDSNEVLAPLIKDLAYRSRQTHADPMGDRRDGESDITYLVTYFTKPGDLGQAL